MSEGAPSFPQGVYRVVGLIPAGRVMTYGGVALVLGSPRAARVVGGALHLLPAGSDVPWHRVVNHQGTISTRGEVERMWEQAARLRAEGVTVDDTLHLELQRYQWWPDRAALRTLWLAPEVLAAVETLIARRRPAHTRTRDQDADSAP